MLANTVRVATEARAAGVTVMFAPIAFAKGYREITSEPYGILKGLWTPMHLCAERGERKS